MYFHVDRYPEVSQRHDLADALYWIRHNKGFYVAFEDWVNDV